MNRLILPAMLVMAVLTGCVSTGEVYVDRGGALRAGTAEQGAAEAEVKTDIAARKAGEEVGFRCFPTGSEPPGWQPDPRCPTAAPQPPATAMAAPQLDQFPVAPQTTQSQSTAEVYGGETILSINIQDAFNAQGFKSDQFLFALDNQLFELYRYNQVISLEVKLAFEGELNRVLNFRENDKTPFETWRRNPNRTRSLSIVVYNRNQAGWREEVWQNNFRRIIACEVTGVENRFIYNRVVASCRNS